MKDTVEAPDWTTIPAPLDDGATRHLTGVRVTAVPLRATNGDMLDLSALPGRVVVYAYPRTGRPGVENPIGWDMIPGARGCTPQSCSFRDHFAELKDLGVDHLFGLSTQDSGYRREAAERLHLPFAIVSDEHLKLTRAMKLPPLKLAAPYC
jgi:peroxiredoxin